MKNVLIYAFCLFTMNAFGQQELLGKWDTQEQQTIVTIDNKSGHLEGRITSSKNPKAPIGRVMLKDLKKKGNQWIGKIYAAKRDQWFDAVISPAKDQLEIKIEVGFFSKTLSWTKVLQ